MQSICSGTQLWHSAQGSNQAEKAQTVTLGGILKGQVRGGERRKELLYLKGAGVEVTCIKGLGKQDITNLFFLYQRKYSVFFIF